MSGEGAWYNEIDPFAAAWLRELIAAGHIAPGIVDERSIEDVRPDELSGYTQCHFFAGIGVWSHALRRAGWPDDRPIWTGSCPCQPFSAAGKGAGFADERHLWPAWQWLIEQCEPVVVAGEQVAGGNVNAWFDLVQADLEGMGYAFGCVPAPSAGFGAPHIRDRAFWMAYAADQRLHGRGTGEAGSEPESLERFERFRDVSGLANSDQPRPQRRGVLSERTDQRVVGPGDLAGRMADADGRNTSAERQQCGGEQRLFESGGLSSWVADPNASERRTDSATGHDSDGHDAGRAQSASDAEGRGRNDHTGPVNGFWRDADWLCCTDGKWRPVEPGTFPLAHGAPARVGRLRGYGNAINAEVATGFIEAVIDHLRASERLAA